MDRYFKVTKAGKFLSLDNNYGDSSSDDLIIGRGAAITGTMLFRKFSFKKLIKFNVLNGDNLLWHFLGYYGKSKHLKNIKNAVYRVHDGGIWSKKTYSYRFTNGIETLQVIRDRIIDIEGYNSYLLKSNKKVIVEYFRNFMYRSFINYDKESLSLATSKIEEVDYISKYDIFISFIEYFLKKTYFILGLARVKRMFPFFHTRSGDDKS